MPDPDAKRIYTEDEVQAILSRAIEHQRVTAAGLSHADLLAVAREAGISAEALEGAVTEVARERAGDDVERAARRRAVTGFRAHLFTYLSVIVVLGIMNLMTTSYPWALWPALGWGLGVLMHMRRALLPSEGELAREEERRERRRRRREDKRGRKAGERVRVEATARARVASDGAGESEGEHEELHADARAKTRRAP
jgi:hypothetical protein